MLFVEQFASKIHKNWHTLAMIEVTGDVNGLLEKKIIFGIK